MMKMFDFIRNIMFKIKMATKRWKGNGCTHFFSC